MLMAVMMILMRRVMSSVRVRGTRDNIRGNMITSLLSPGQILSCLSGHLKLFQNCQVVYLSKMFCLNDLNE